MHVTTGEKGEDTAMRFAINLPAFAALADTRELAELAHQAEDAGWDGFFLWDHIQAEPGMPVADPWVTLTAIAMRTQRIRLGPLVTPLPRRRPAKLARETVTLDHLSNGRLILGVGIGGDRWFKEYSTFGEGADDKLHAAMLDEHLEVLTGLWSGQPYSHEGRFYTVHNAQFLPTPVQTPRIPIWVSGIWPNKAPFRRAARWDGVFPIVGGPFIEPEQVSEMMTYIGQHRTGDASFDVVVAGFVGNMEPSAATDRLRRFAEAGVTWWQEGFWYTDSLDDVRTRIQQGPPALS
jgi:alkanesulfonate monooxygenase SsuD/methylene tetrahydromethanopterin reductase-like flavin-dependent oxidoreductase (luciferase family)